MREAFVLFILFIAQGKAQVANLEAPAQVDVVNGELVVKCAPSGNGFNFISRLEIKRKLVSESSYITILYVEDPPKGSDPVFRDNNLALKATTEGRAGRVSGALLNFSVSAGRVTCEDGGSYQCKITHTGANNESLTVTSASVNVAVVANPSSGLPVFNLSPSNVPGSTDNVYLKGTTIVLICQSEVGSPARPMRFCHRPAGMPNFLPVSSTQSDVVTPASTEPGKICILSRTIVATFAIADNAGEFSCDVYNATSNASCGTYLKTSVRSYSGQEYPYCNASNADSTTTTTTTTTSTTTASPTTTNSISIDETFIAQDSSGVSYTGGLSLLLLGCALIFLSGIMVAVSAILYIKAKKLRKEAEMSMIRSTYDSMHFNAGPGPNYSSLEDLKEQTPHRQIEELDSDGYMVPSMTTYK